MPNTRHTALPRALALSVILMLVLAAAAVLPGPGPQRAAGLAGGMAGEPAIRPVDPGTVSLAASAPARWQASLRELSQAGAPPAVDAEQRSAGPGVPGAIATPAAERTRTVRLLI